MGNLLKSGAAWLASVQKQHAGEPIVYRRGDDSVALAATIGRTEFQRVDAAGVAINFTSRDYFVEASKLVLAGERTTPRPGDRITEADVAGIEEVYEVLDLGSEHCWKWSDPYRVRMRIHTKAVESET